MGNQFDKQLQVLLENEMYGIVDDRNKTINLWAPAPGQTVSVRPISGPLTVTGQGVHVLVPLGYRYTFSVETYLKATAPDGVNVYRWRIQNIEYIVLNFWARMVTFIREVLKI